MSDWISKIKTDENQALSEIYRLLREDTIMWLQRDFGLSVIDAEDIFQVSVVILYDNVITGKLTELTSSLMTYVGRIARNKSMELIRKKKKMQLSDISSELLSDHVLYQQDEITNEEQINLINHALESLGDPCKSILVKFYYQNKKIEEITSELQYKNADTTKNLKYKCLKRLQNIFFSHNLKN
ncbi:MAG: sigma-70 family RNA polymerase sigma factor [Saprospiraceae bacterium]|nr:sigma-70 family RNA polymerase sigma factor [Saprospiraceae bacterium]